MDQQSVYTSTQQLQTQLWTRTFTLACAIGLMMLTLLASDLLCASQKPLLSEAAEKINPNTASIGSLVRLPGIGKARALDIIHYRDRQPAGQPAFESAPDMENISGIGPKTAAKLEPYLIFEYQDNP